MFLELARRQRFWDEPFRFPCARDVPRLTHCPIGRRAHDQLGRGTAGCGLETDQEAMELVNRWTARHHANESTSKILKDGTGSFGKVYVATHRTVAKVSRVWSYRSFCHSDRLTTQSQGWGQKGGLEAARAPKDDPERALSRLDRRAVVHVLAREPDLSACP